MKNDICSKYITILCLLPVSAILIWIGVLVSQVYLWIGIAILAIAAILGDSIRCPKCGHRLLRKNRLPKFCPNCGKKVRNEKTGE